MANTNKLVAFAAAVGTDIKGLSSRLSVVEQGDFVKQTDLIKSITKVRSEILGEGVPENLDTLREIADAIKAFEEVDLVAAYNVAKE